MPKHPNYIRVNGHLYRLARASDKVASSQRVKSALLSAQEKAEELAHALPIVSEQLLNHPVYRDDTSNLSKDDLRDWQKVKWELENLVQSSGYLNVALKAALKSFFYDLNRSRV